MIWVGTEKGLNRFIPSSGTFDSFFTDANNPNSISSDMVWAFFEDQKQQLWLGTSGGSLNRWDADDRADSIERFHHFSENISLPSSNIYGIQADARGHLWLSHNRGITSFNPETLETSQFGIRDGLQDSEYNMGAYFSANSGELYFGGNRGYNTVPAQGIEIDSIAPKVAIDSIKIMNERKSFNVPY